MRGASPDDGHLTERRTSEREQDCAGCSGHVERRFKSITASPEGVLTQRIAIDVVSQSVATAPAAART